MSQPSAPADIHSTLELIKAGKTSPARVLGAALKTAASPACRNVYMPGFEPQTGAATAAGDVQGPLSGIPFSVKDLFDIAGQPTKLRATSARRRPVAGIPAESSKG